MSDRWQSNPAAPGYKDTTGVINPAFPGGKAGGVVVTTIVATVVGTGTTTLSPTINDYSGSSFDYYYLATVLKPSLSIIWAR